MALRLPFFLRPFRCSFLFPATFLQLEKAMVPYSPTPSTLKPAEVAVAMVEAAVAKHQTRIDMIFFKAVRLFRLAMQRHPVRSLR